MKMRLLKIALCSAVPALALALSGCETLGTSSAAPSPLAESQPSAAPSKPSQFTDEESAVMRKVAEQYVHDVLTGLSERNYKLYIKNFTDEIKVDINEAAFNAMVDEFNKKKGPYVGRQYLGDLTQGYFKVFLWKAQFEPSKELVEALKKQRKDVGSIMKGDTLIRLEIGKVDGAYKAFGIYFQ